MYNTDNGTAMFSFIYEVILPPNIIHTLTSQFIIGQFTCTIF